MYNTEWELVIPGRARNDSGDQHWPLYRCEAPGGWIYKQSISPAGVDTLQYVPAPNPEAIERQRDTHFSVMYGQAIEEDALRTWETHRAAEYEKSQAKTLALKESRENQDG